MRTIDKVKHALGMVEERDCTCVCEIGEGTCRNCLDYDLLSDVHGELFQGDQLKMGYEAILDKYAGPEEKAHLLGELGFESWETLAHNLAIAMIGEAAQAKREAEKNGPPKVEEEAQKYVSLLACVPYKNLLTYTPPVEPAI